MDVGNEALRLLLDVLRVEGGSGEAEGDEFMAVDKQAVSKAECCICGGLSLNVISAKVGVVVVDGGRGEGGFGSGDLDKNSFRLGKVIEDLCDLCSSLGEVWGLEGNEERSQALFDLLLFSTF